MQQHDHACVDVAEQSELATSTDTSPSTATAIGELVVELYLDDALMAWLHRTAERCAAQPRGSLPARDIVTDVLGDLLTGDFVPTVWTRPELDASVRAEVKRRGKATRKGRHARMVSLDRASAHAMVDMSGDPEPNRDFISPELLPDIFELARDDLPARSLLHLYETHALLAERVPRRRDVLELGMKPWIYRRARERVVAYGEAARAAKQASAESDDE